MPETPVRERAAPLSPDRFATPERMGLSDHFSSVNRVPETPIRKSVAPLSPFQKLVKAIHVNSAINYMGKQYAISAIPDARGEHSQLFQIESDENLLPGVSNDALLIKVYLEKTVIVSDRSPEKLWLPTSLKQYRYLRGIGFPTITIYNEKTAEKDGFFIVEKVQPLSKKDLTSEKIRKEIVRLFLIAKNDPSSIPVDFQLSNFGLNSDGQLVLLDFMEHDEEEKNAFSLIRERKIEEIARVDRDLALQIREAIAKDDKKLV